MSARLLMDDIHPARSAPPGAPYGTTSSVNQIVVRFMETWQYKLTKKYGLCRDRNHVKPNVVLLRGKTEREGLTSWDKDSWIYYDYYNILNYRSSSSNGFSLNNKSMLILVWRLKGLASSDKLIPALSLSNPSMITIFLHASVNFEKNI